MLGVHPFRVVEAQHARVFGVAREEAAVGDRLERAFAAHVHRNADRLREFGGAAELRFDRPADVGVDRPDTRQRRQFREGGGVDVAGVPGRRGATGGAALPERRRSAAPASAAGERAGQIAAGEDGDGVEHARLREASDELILQAHAERHHAGERRDPDRHAERRQRRTQLRLPEVSQREADGVPQRHD